MTTTTSKPSGAEATETAPRTYLNYIAGEWRPSASGETFDDTNPARRSEIVARFQKSTPADVDAAVRAAEAALPAWRALPAPARGEIMLRAALILERERDRLARQMTREMGKPLKETQGDLQTAIDFGKYTAGEGRRAEGETVPSALADKLCLTLRQPLGVVGIITPWNFPIAIPAWKTLPALLAGNTVVLKPAATRRCSAAALVEVLIEAGLPAGRPQLRHRPRRHAGRHAGGAPARQADLVHRLERGRRARRRAVRRAICERVQLELGGKNP